MRLRFHLPIGHVLTLLCCSLTWQPLSAQSSSQGQLPGTGPDADLRAFRLGELETRLSSMQPGPERNYFAGILDNRTGHVEDSIRLLTDALPSLRSRPARAAVALEALADDYNKTFRYAEADRAYDDLLAHFATQLTADELKGTRDDAGVAHLLRRAPPQTIAWHGPTNLKTERDAIGSLVTELTVNGVPEKWLLDTGANMSVVSKSFAARLGLKPLPGFGQTMSGLTGIENPLQVALIPELPMGGATLRNVAVLVLDDDNLNIKLPDRSYQISGVLGYPVFQSLGVVTFLHDGGIEAGSGARSGGAETRMYMRLLMPVIECKVDGRELPFTFDTGASGTNLSIRYYREFQSRAKEWTTAENATAGGGGMVRRKVYLQPVLELGIGAQTATIRNATIFPTKIGTDKDDLYGNLGQDVVAGFSSYTLDFTNMTFSVGDRLQPPSDSAKPAS
jgi:predicted aspartyl protease